MESGPLRMSRLQGLHKARQKARSLNRARHALLRRAIGLRKHKMASAPQEYTKCAQLQISAAYTMCSAAPFNRYGRNVLCNNDFDKTGRQDCKRSTKGDKMRAAETKQSMHCSGVQSVFASTRWQAVHKARQNAHSLRRALPMLLEKHHGFWSE